jgi:ribulose kinase
MLSTNHHAFVVLFQDEAAEINRTGHEVLECVGGQVSLEMQLPKLLWLKRHAAASCWARARHFFDLPDWLTYRATGGGAASPPARSLCSLVCTWNYWVRLSGNVVGWDRDFFSAAGLWDLAAEDWARIGGEGGTVLCPGSAVGLGLSATAAAELGGLSAGTPVGTSLIDAHAGMLGMLPAAGGEPLEGRLGKKQQRENKMNLVLKQSCKNLLARQLLRRFLILLAQNVMEPIFVNVVKLQVHLFFRITYFGF